MRFDWYTATVPLRADLVVDRLSQHLGTGAVLDVKEGRGLNGYTHRVDFVRDGVEAGMVNFGGHNVLPSIQQSGEGAHAFSELVRRLFPASPDPVEFGHRVSRMDSRQDFNGPGSWEKLFGVVSAFAASAKLDTFCIGDWVGGVKGRTFYVGSKSSPVRVRLYEKGCQMAAELADMGVEPEPDWCRLEVVVKPQKEARYAAAACTPEEAWGYSKWSQILIGQACGLDVERTTMNVHREADYERSFRHMCNQYGSVLERIMAEEGGSPEALGRRIMGLLIHKEEAVRGDQKGLHQRVADHVEFRHRAQGLH